MRFPLHLCFLLGWSLLTFPSGAVLAQVVDKGPPASEPAEKEEIFEPLAPRDLGLGGAGEPLWSPPASHDEKESFLFSEAPRQDDPLSFSEADLSPIPEPATVLLVTLAGMLTIFRRRSRPR